MDKFNHKYRIQSIRLQHWDYRWDAAYFITICTKKREHFFGEIHDDKMQLTPVGAIADVLWHEIKNHAKNIELGAFIVMPNHIHGILILIGNNNDNDTNTLDENRVNTDGGTNIDSKNKSKNEFKNEFKNDSTDDSTDDSMNGSTDDSTIVETGHALSLRSAQPSAQPSGNQTDKTIGQQRFQNIGENSVSSIIGSYKSAVTKHVHRLDFEFEWQTRFHDHIIRDNPEYNRIQQYIINNPINWKDDKFNAPPIK